MKRGRPPGDPALQMPRTQRLAAGVLAGISITELARRERLSRTYTSQLVHSPAVQRIVGTHPRRARNERLAAGFLRGISITELARREGLDRSYVSELLHSPGLQRIIEELRASEVPPFRPISSVTNNCFRGPGLQTACALIDRALPGLSADERHVAANAWRAGVQFGRIMRRTISRKKLWKKIPRDLVEL